MSLLQQIKVLYIEDDKELQKELQIFLKRRESDNKTPIIITTAFSESETILDMIINGITSYYSETY